jgi:hypothetical protein
MYYGWETGETGCSHVDRVWILSKRRVAIIALVGPSRTTGGVGVCPLDRAVGVNPGFALL